MSISKISLIALSGLALSDATGCTKFSDVYADGNATSTFWGDAFTYETDEAKAYDIWFTDAANNPNDDVTKALVADGIITDASAHFDANGLVDRCYLDFDHKNLSQSVDNNVHPFSDPEDFTICTPWAERSCCTHDTVKSIDIFKARMLAYYGMGSSQCGELSAACSQKFVEEECFYSCSPNAGLYRKYPEAGAPDVSQNATTYDPITHDGDEWKVSGMPVKSSWWDGMYDACKDDFIDLSEESSGYKASAGSASLAVAVAAAILA